jgi:anion transporter
MPQMLTTLLILALMTAAFVTRRIPAFVAAWLGALALAFLGILPMKSLFSGFSNPTLILFAGMFVIGDSLFQTGLAGALGNRAVRLLGNGERPLLWATMMAAGVISTVASNTGTTAALLPVVLGMCRAAGLPASRQLMPLAFASGFGGFSALIGTPPNMILSQALAHSGRPAFGFFEFAWIGIPMAIAGMVFMDFARRWLPSEGGKTDSAPVEATGQRPSRLKMGICAAILAGVVGVMVFGGDRIPLEAAAVAGAALCVVTGCMTGKQALAAVEWDTILLFGGMFAVAEAMQAAGVSALLGNAMVHALGGHPQGWLVVALPLICTMALGTVLSNTACAVLMAPVGLALAGEIGANPQPILMAIAVAASCSFLTPLGTPPNLLVWEPGGYRFSDYVKVGAGLSLVCLIVGVIIIPWHWPVFGAG